MINLPKLSDQSKLSSFEVLHYLKNTLIAIFVFAALYTGCKAGYRNVEDIKLNSTNTLSAAGYKIIGYEGYQWFPTGGSVWYSFERNNNTNILYHAGLSKWGDEYHIYSIEAINAVSNVK